MPQVTFYINKREDALLKAKCKDLKCSPYAYAKAKLVEALKDERGRDKNHSKDDDGGNSEPKKRDSDLEDWFQ